MALSRIVLASMAVAVLALGACWREAVADGRAPDHHAARAAVAVSAPAAAAHPLPTTARTLADEPLLPGN